MRNFNQKIALIWILPSVLMLVIFLLYPVIFNVGLSFFKWDGYSQQIFSDFISFSNYVELFKDSTFLKALKNTLVFVFFSISVQNIVALFLAVFLFLGEFKASNVLRAIIFYPSILSPVIVAIIWRNVVLIRGGLINQLTELLGLPDFYPLSSPKMAFYVLITIAIWQGLGFNLVIHYANLQSLDMEVLEASRVDGANFWQTIFRVVIPLQIPIIIVIVILNLISGFQIFDLVWVLTHGGPIHSTEVMGTYMVYVSFTPEISKMSYGSTIANIIMILTLFFTVARYVLIKRRT